MLKFVPFGSYQPDAAKFHDPSVGMIGWSPTATNVIPTSVTNIGGSDQVGYGPFPSFVPYSAPVSGRVLGAYSMFEIPNEGGSANVNIFAGTTEKLLQLTILGGNTFADVSGATYNANGIWSFAAQGNQIIATNGEDSVQQITLGSDTEFSDLNPGTLASIKIENGGTGYTEPPTITITGGNGSLAAATCTVAGGVIDSVTITNHGKDYFNESTLAINALSGTGSGALLTGTLSPAAPRGRYAATVRDFLFLAYTTDPTDGTRPQRIWWSGIGTPSQWPNPGSNLAVEVQSDYQDIWGSQGVITGIVPAVGRADAIVVFERALYEISYGGAAIFSIQPVVGASGSYAPASIVQAAGMMFYYSQSGFIMFDGQTSNPIGVNRVDSKIATELDPSYVSRIVGSVDPVRKCCYWIYPGSGSSGGAGNTILCYHYQFDKWSSATVEADTIFPAITFDLNLEDLAAIYPDLDTMTVSLDSPIFAKNNWVLGGFDGNHRLGYFTGQPLTPIVDSPMFVIGDGQNTPTDTRGAVFAMRPVFDSGSAVASCQLASRETFSSDFTWGPVVTADQYGTCYVRQSGRQFVARLTVSGNYNQLLGIDIDAKPAGRR